LYRSFRRVPVLRRPSRESGRLVVHRFRFLWCTAVRAAPASLGLFALYVHERPPELSGLLRLTHLAARCDLRSQSGGALVTYSQAGGRRTGDGPAAALATPAAPST